MLQRDGELDRSVGLGQFPLEDGGEVLQKEWQTEAHSVKVPDGTQELGLGSDQFEPLVPAVHRGLELDLVLVHLLLLLHQLQPEDNNCRSTEEREEKRSTDLM